MKILETNRFYLRELNTDDAENFYLLNEDKEVVKYTGDVPFTNVIEARNFLENYDQYKKFGIGRWAIIEKKTNTFMGWCGLKYTEDVDEYDIGFRIFKKYWYIGIATETSKACLKYGLEILGIKEIVGRVMNENLASIRVSENIGMKYLKKIDFDGEEGKIFVIKKS